MKSINYYEVQILKDGTKKFKVELLKVCAENENELVVERYNRFYILNKKSDRYSTSPDLNKPSISEWKVCLEGIHYYLYSTRKVRPDTIKREIAEFVSKEYGYLNEINLDFIK